MTESTQTRKFTRSHVEKDSIRAETTSDGRYIPHSGGIMGWFENSGVLKCEQRSGYRYFEMIDAEAVRSKLFERWGSGETVNRRAAERHSVSRKVSIAISRAGETSVVSTATDYSSHGLRVHLTDSGNFSLNKGDSVNVIIYDKPEGGQALFEIPSKIMWVSQSARAQQSSSIGIAFMEIPHEQREKLTAFFRS